MAEFTKSHQMWKPAFSPVRKQKSGWGERESSVHQEGQTHLNLLAEFAAFICQDLQLQPALCRLQLCLSPQLLLLF